MVRTRRGPCARTREWLSGPMDRDIIVVAFDARSDQKLALRCLMPFCVNEAGQGYSLLDVLNISLRSTDAVAKSIQSGTRSQRLVSSVQPLAASDVRIYSWRRSLIDPTLAAAASPAPGVIICLVRPVDHRGPWPPPGADMDAAVAMARAVIDFNVQGEFQAVHDFLRGPDARVEPVSATKWDVFLSHATSDAKLAAELHGDLEKRGLRTFVLK